MSSEALREREGRRLKLTEYMLSDMIGQKIKPIVKSRCI
jgi:hypothetical protein